MERKIRLVFLCSSYYFFRWDEEEEEEEPNEYIQFLNLHEGDDIWNSSSKTSNKFLVFLKLSIQDCWYSAIDVHIYGRKIRTKCIRI